MKIYVSRNFKHTSKAKDGTLHICKVTYILLQRKQLRQAGFVFRFGMFQPSYYQLVLTYNASTRITYGLLLSKTSEHQIPKVMKALKEDPWRCRQPLFPAVLIAELSVFFSAERIQHTELKLNELEQTMGQHEYANMNKGSPIRIDFESAGSSLNFHTQWLAVQTMRLNSVLLALDDIMHDTHKIAKKNNSKVVEKKWTAGFDKLSMMEEFVARLVNMDKNLLFRAEYESKRIGALTPVVTYPLHSIWECADIGRYTNSWPTRMQSRARRMVLQ
jgi:hypothetical protein